MQTLQQTEKGLSSSFSKQAGQQQQSHNEDSGTDLFAVANHKHRRTTVFKYQKATLFPSYQGLASYAFNWIQEMPAASC